MADLTFGQQLAANTLGVVLGGGISILAGWGILRRQERIKHDEELAGTLRRVQADALVRVLAAIGKYHTLKTRRFTWERDERGNVQEAARAVMQEEGDAFAATLSALSDVYFLLGGELGRTVRRGLFEMGNAKTAEDTERAVARLEVNLAPWIPPLAARDAKR